MYILVIKITPGLSRALERRLIQNPKKSFEILPKPGPHLPGDRDMLSGTAWDGVQKKKVRH